MGKGTIENEGSIPAEVEREAEPTSFGEYLRGLRIKSCFSVKKAADAIGISPVYLWKLEREKNPNPGFRIAIEMAETYGVRIGKLGDQWAKFWRLRIVERIENLFSQQSTLTWIGPEITNFSDGTLQQLEAFLDSIVNP